PIGSDHNAKTTGTVEIASLTARAELPVVTMSSTLRRANSAAISAPRSLRPPAQRYSIAMLRPSVQPSPRSRCWNAAVQGAQADGVDEPKRPIVGSLDACCALAASGHATAAPPSSVMNSRRFVRSPRRRGRVGLPVHPGQGPLLF